VGTVGVKDGKKLEVINSDGPVSAANMGEETRRTFGITKRMPLTKEESIREFISDGVLRSVLGAELTDKYISVNKVSFENDILFAQMSSHILIHRLSLNICKLTLRRRH
jgi:glutamine synthetase